MRGSSSLLCGAFFTILISGWGGAQTLQPRPPATPSVAPPETQAAPAALQTVALTVPAGTPLKIALEKDVRVRKAGDPITGRTVEPIYAFDKLVVPAGTEVTGIVQSIAPVPGKKRALAALNADLSPQHEVVVTFQQLHMPDGSTLPLQTQVSPGTAGVLQLVQAPPGGPTQKARNIVSKQIAAARQQVRQEWDTARNDITKPGKFHRLERYAFAQSPYRPQYIDAGTTYDAVLEQPLDFGSEPLNNDEIAKIATQPPAGCMIHAELLTPLSSATSKKGDAVEALITQPLFDGKQLIFPQGSKLEGTVLQVRPARRLHRNGLLRITFHQIVLPNGVSEKVDASLQAVAVAQEEHLKMDSEGGAEVTTPKLRYLSTAVTVALASTAMSTDHDAATDHGTDASRSAVGGGLGFRTVGIIVGAVVHSRVFSSAMGFYGAGMSVYQRFLTRGTDVVYPKDMSMVVGLAAAPNAKTVSEAEKAR